VNFSNGIEVSRPNDGQRSWNWLWGAVPFLLLSLFFAWRSAKENDVAGSQQTSSGMITDCHSTRGGQSCAYTFPVNERPFIGRSDASVEYFVGRPVLVYYASRDPEINVIEDFSAVSRRDRTVAGLALLVAIAVAAFVRFAMAPYRARPHGEPT
jgi:hypothetical protein